MVKVMMSGSVNAFRDPLPYEPSFLLDVYITNEEYS